MKIKELVAYLDSFAHPGLQESYDNAGLITGSPENDLTGVLIAIDTTEEVIEEAAARGCNLVVSHHPVIFNGLKRLTGSNYTERAVMASIRNEVAVYASHTNLDAVRAGVNGRICQKLHLQHCRILKPISGMLRKLVCFVPHDHLVPVRTAVFSAGAGHIGNYDSCGYQLKGEGTFRALEGANPFVGETGALHTEPETRLETIFPAYLQYEVVRAMLEAHPYEEVAYDIYPLENKWAGAGQGMVGELKAETGEREFLEAVKETLGTPFIRHSKLLGRKLKKVAVCGGSGSHLIGEAIRAKADVFLTADIKYHQFFDSDEKILLADMGHYESEQFTKEIFYELIIKKFPNFAVQFSEIDTNPVKYL